MAMPFGLKRGALPLVVGLALVGCVQQGLPTASLAGAEGVAIRGRVALRGLPAGRALLQFGSEVRPPKPADVAHLKVYLQRMDQAASEALVGTLPGIPASVELKKLRPNAIYKVRLEAEDDSSQRLDDNAPEPDEANGLGWSESLVATANLALQEDLSFRLKLQDLPFSGAGTGQVALQEGQFLPPVLDERAASGPWLDATGVVGPRLLHANGQDYLLNHNTFNVGDDLAHLHFNPRGLGSGDEGYLPPDFFGGCGFFNASNPGEMVGQDPSQVPFRLVARNGYLNSIRAGYKGVLVDGVVVSVPWYHAEDFQYDCPASPAY